MTHLIESGTVEYKSKLCHKINSAFLTLPDLKAFADQREVVIHKTLAQCL
jgi:hypothetical protein